MTHLYYNSRYHFVLDFANNCHLDSYSNHVVGFGSVHKAKQMVQLLLDMGKVRHSHQNYQ